LIRKFVSAAFLLVVAPSLFAADIVPLSTSIKFETAAARASEPITLLVSPELSQLVIPKKLRFLRLQFPIGNAVAVNTETALRSAFTRVRLARSADDVETNRVLELKSVEVDPKLPLTTFGTYKSNVKLTYVLRDARKKTEREIVVTGDGGNKKSAGRVLWDSGWKWTEAQQLAKATDLAELDALDKLLEELAK
jgi:hypothetical protein